MTTGWEPTLCSFCTVRVKVAIQSCSSVVVLPGMASGTLQWQQVTSHSFCRNSFKILRYNWGIVYACDMKLPPRHAQNDDHVAAISCAEFIEGYLCFLFCIRSRYRETELPHVKCSIKSCVLKCQHTIDFVTAGDAWTHLQTFTSHFGLIFIKFVTDVTSLRSVKFVVLFYGSVGSRINKWSRRSSILCITHSAKESVLINVYRIALTGGRYFPKGSCSIHSTIFPIRDLMYVCTGVPRHRPKEAIGCK